MNQNPCIYEDWYLKILAFKLYVSMWSFRVEVDLETVRTKMNQILRSFEYYLLGTSFKNAWIN